MCVLSGSDRTDQIHRIIADAAIRRFKAQKLYLRATAALRWVNARTTILQGQRPHAGHAPALQQIRNQLRNVSHQRQARGLRDGELLADCVLQELASITDARVDTVLRQADSAEGKWLAEDPSLAAIQRVVGNGNGSGR